MAHRISSPFPMFPAILPPSRHHGSSTEVRFSRWNNANAQPFIRRQREQHEIEADIRLHRRHHSAARIAEDPEDAASGAAAPPSAVDYKSRGTPSSPSPPSIPGKASKYSKPELPIKSSRSSSHPGLRRIARATGRGRLPPEPDGETGISVGEEGVSYRFKDAPFHFKYSYTETPEVMPLGMREPPFSPFGPATMPRPWTGRAPLPACKKKLPEFDSFKLPPPGKKGVKPVQAPGPFLAGSGPKYTAASREEILGAPLTEEELKILIKGSLKTRRQLNMGRDGLTHNMLENIHAHWKRKRICKIKCKGVCTVDMDKVRQQLEEKTGGKIIYNKGGVIFLFRGRNYNYRTRRRYPLMLWKPITPVYPRLVQQVPEGLTLEEATEMRKKGHTLPPIRKLGKNGLYSHLVQHVREAFEECELVRINCKDMNPSDYRKIGGKLKGLVPCVLLSFAYEHILMWRGRDWKSSLPPLEGNHDESVGLVANGPPTTPTGINSLLNNQQILGSGNCSNELDANEEAAPVKDVGIEETDGPSNLETMDQPLLIPSTKIWSDEDSCMVVPRQSISSDNGLNLEVSEDASLPDREPQLLPASSGGSTLIENNGVGTRTESVDITDGSEITPTDGLPCQSAMRSSACLDGVMLLLSQAVESGRALVLDDGYLDANVVYERSVALANTAPCGPAFQQRIRKTVVRRAKAEEEKIEKFKEVDVEVVTVPEKRGSERKNPRSRRREDLREILSGVAPSGSLRVDELAKLLA